MEEKDILSQIHSLVEEEHQLRAGADHTDTERSRMGQLEAQLDQCWDLLRQRRAKSQYGENPDDASARPEPEVGRYLQ